MSTGQWNKLSSYGSQPSVADAQSYYSYHSGMGQTEKNQFRYLAQVQNSANKYRAQQRTAAQASLSNYGQRTPSKKRKSTRKQRRNSNQTRRSRR